MFWVLMPLSQDILAPAKPRVSTRIRRMRIIYKSRLNVPEHLWEEIMRARAICNLHLQYILTVKK